MKILIADDEPLALRRMEIALACIPEAEVVASASSGSEASILIEQLRPDVAILDVEMPDRDGLSVLEAIGRDDHLPEVIFATAFRHYACQAFDLAAVDYITKPIAFERLRDAVRRAASRLEARNADQRFAAMQNLVASLQGQISASGDLFDDHLWVRTRDGMTRLPVGLITLIEAEGDYVMLHASDGAYIHRDTMRALERRLDPGKFARCHRSMIVNLGYVRGLRRRSGRSLVMTLTNGREVPVGPAYVNHIAEIVRLKRWRS